MKGGQRGRSASEGGHAAAREKERNDSSRVTRLSDSHCRAPLPGTARERERERDGLQREQRTYHGTEHPQYDLHVRDLYCVYIYIYI